MNPNQYRTIALLTFLFLGSTACRQAERDDTPARPNIIIILADDLGYGDPEVYNDESKIPTPHINAMAAEGMRFTDAHSPSSVCTPSRYGLLTGRYAWRTPLKRSVLWPWDKSLIEKDRETMPKMLKKQGYHTACIGKWHLGWRWPGMQGGFINDTIPYSSGFSMKDREQLWKKIDFSQPLGGGPLEAGFDYYFGDDIPNYPPYAFFEGNQLQALPDTLKPAGMHGRPGPMVSGWNLAEVMPAITQKAVSYIEDQGTKGAPFFLYFALTAPHDPIVPSKDFIGRSSAGLYGDFVNQVDYTVGQVVEALKRTGQWENTILIFTSDNGSPHMDGQNMAGRYGSIKKYGHDPSRPLKGMKADIWEGGHRVPFIVTWPGKVKSESVSHQLFGLNDLMATFAAVTDAPNQEYEDSFDFRTVWLGASNDPVREDLVHHSINGMFSIRKGPWKLILGKGSGGWSGNPDNKPGVVLPPGQLYNLAEDLAEQNNLYTEYPEIVAELTARLDRYKEQGFSNPDFK